MPSKYRQKCNYCRKWIVPGDRVFRVYVVADNIAGVELQVTGRELWQHAHCPSPN